MKRGIINMYNYDVSQWEDANVRAFGTRMSIAVDNVMNNEPKTRDWKFMEGSEILDSIISTLDNLLEKTSKSGMVNYKNVLEDIFFDITNGVNTYLYYELDSPVSVIERIELIKQTVTNKNQAYGNSFDKGVDLFGVTGASIRIFDKLNRLKSLTNGADNKVSDEGIADTLVDIVGYMMLSLAYETTEDDVFED